MGKISTEIAGLLGSSANIDEVAISTIFCISLTRLVTATGVCDAAMHSQDSSTHAVPELSAEGLACAKVSSKIVVVPRTADGFVGIRRGVREAWT